MISHNWTEEDRLRLIYRIAESHIYFLRKDVPPHQKVNKGKDIALMIAMISGESSEFLELNRVNFDEYLEEDEK